MLCSVVAGALHTVVADLGDVQQLRKAELFQLFDFGVQLGDRYDPRGEVQRQLSCRVGSAKKLAVWSG